MLRFIFRIPDPVSQQAIKTRYSIHSSRLSGPVWVWGSRSAEPLSRIMAGACGLQKPAPMAPALKLYSRLASKRRADRGRKSTFHLKGNFARKAFCPPIEVYFPPQLRSDHPLDDARAKAFAGWCFCVSMEANLFVDALVWLLT